MNKASPPAILALIVLCIIAGSAPRTIASAQTASSIAAIRQRYTTINRNQAKYKQIKKDLLGFSTEGGELLVYLDGPAIVKMVATFYGESGKAFEEYYYRDHQLIFVFRKESRYDKPLSGRIVASQEQRFYFNNGQLIKWLDEKGKSVLRGKEYSEKQQEVFYSSRQFTEGSRSQGSTIEASK